MLPPTAMVWVAGVAAVEKSAVALRIRFAERVWLMAPALPVMTSGKGAVGFAAVVTTVMMVVPELTIKGGLKVALAPLGKPPAVKVTGELKPLVRATDIA